MIIFTKIKSLYPVSDSCFLLNTAYKKRSVKNDPLKKNITTAKDCQKECLNHDECKYWTWKSPEVSDFWSRNFCYLREGIGIIVSGKKSTIGKISGPKRCKEKDAN